MGVCVMHPRRVASQSAIYCICVGIIAYDESQWAIIGEGMNETGEHISKGYFGYTKSSTQYNVGSAVVF